MAETDAIVLAAGLSRRMGDDNKLLLEIGGATLLSRVVDACLGVCDGAVTVVLGHEAERVRASLGDAPLRFVVNPGYSEGQMSSVHAGLAASAAAHTIVALGDQPDLTAESLRALVTAHLKGAGGRITVPMRGEDRGNPIVVPATLRGRILRDDMRLGCRRLTRDHPELVHPFATDDPAFFTDIDTPGDYATRTAKAGPCPA